MSAAARADFLAGFDETSPKALRGEGGPNAECRASPAPFAGVEPPLTEPIDLRPTSNRIGYIY
jgi:hypothetical protein